MSCNIPQIRSSNRTQSEPSRSIDDQEDADDIGHYSLVIAIEYKYYSKFIDCLDAIGHWLCMIASQIRYLLRLNE